MFRLECHVCHVVVGNHVLSVEYGGSSDSTLLDVLRSECTVRYVSGIDVCRVSLSELDQHTVTPEQGHARAQASPADPAGRPPKGRFPPPAYI